jgi:hypothetical protein
VSPARRGATAAAFATLALGAAACGRTVDSGQLESQIADFVNRTTGASIKVSCPDNVKAEKGKKFTCTSSGAGQRGTIVIEFVTADGKFRIASMSSKPVSVG